MASEGHLYVRFHYSWRGERSIRVWKPLAIRRCNRSKLIIFVSCEVGLVQMILELGAKHQEGWWALDGSGL